MRIDTMGGGRPKSLNGASDLQMRHTIKAKKDVEVVIKGRWQNDVAKLGRGGN